MHSVSDLFLTVIPVAILGAGIAAMVTAVGIQWRRLFPYVGRKAQIGRFELPATMVLTALLAVFSIQYVALVYAMAFSLSATTSEVKDTVDVVMGDFDGDGDLDYIAGNTDATDTYKLDLYTNDGTGTFSASTFGTSLLFESMAAGDIDGDGDLDLVVTVGTTVYKYTNDGTGSFTQAVAVSGLSTAVQHILLMDADSDGDLDIVVTSDSSGLSTILYTNNGSGTFTAAASPMSLVGAAIASADFDSDGYVDLAVGVSGGIKVMHNSGTGAFVQLSSTVLITTPTGLQPVDLDGDGDIDLLIAMGNKVYDYINDGAGTLGSDTSFGSVTTAYSVATGDLDNTGDMDFGIAGCGNGTTGGGAHFFANNGGGTFAELAAPTETGDCIKRIAIGDIDNDGDLDYIRGNRDPSGSSGQANRHYVSDQATISANTAPTAPSAATMTGAFVAPSAKSTASGSDLTGTGTVAWTNPTNIYASDNSYGTVSFGAPNGISHYLKAVGFNFAIPSTATIRGIKAEIERKSTVSGIKDQSVRIVKGGTIGSTERGVVATWPLADAYATFGSGGDLWGTTWTPSDINASNFGFAIAVRDSGAGGGVGNVDHIRITVYTDLGGVTLSWGSGSDTQTATRLLQYKVKVGTTSGGSQVLSSLTTSPNWVGRVMPNGQSRRLVLTNLPCDANYYWNVASVDAGFKSAWSTQQTFSLSSACTFSGSLLSSSSSSEQTGGNGWFLTFLRSANRKKLEDEKRAGFGTVTIRAYRDLNRNGEHNAGEDLSFGELPVTILGTTAEGRSIAKTVLLSASGEARVTIRAGDETGYTLRTETSSTVVSGQEATGPSTIRLIVTKDSDQTFEIGFSPVTILRADPCLTIDPSPSLPPSTDDAVTLLQRLRDRFNQSVLRDLSPGKGLITRRQFLMLAGRVHCTPMLYGESERIAGLRAAFQKGTVPGWTTLRLPDLSFGDASPDSVIVASLLAKGIPVLRSSRSGPVADLDSPISRREAVLVVSGVMDIPEQKRSVRGVPAPSDLASDDVAHAPYLILRRLGILPKGFLARFDAPSGITFGEAALLLDRSAFSAGRLGFFRDPTDPTVVPVPTFLSVLPSAFHLPVCVAPDDARAAGVRFRDVLPGDPLHADVLSLIPIGVANTEGRKLWILPGTARTTEFGVSRGAVPLSPALPVTMLELIRSMLVLSCTPPPTTTDLLTGRHRAQAIAAGEQLVMQDALDNLQRDASFVSRAFFRAQDRQRAYNLSLFTYAPGLLQASVHAPTDGVTIADASQLIASTVLGIAVKQEVLGSAEADRLLEPLTQSLLSLFLGHEATWKDLTTAKNTVLTREMLIRALAVIVQNRRADPAPSSGLSVPELWWNRLR